MQYNQSDESRFARDPLRTHVGKKLSVNVLLFLSVVRSLSPCDCSYAFYRTLRLFRCYILEARLFRFRYDGARTSSSCHVWTKHIWPVAGLLFLCHSVTSCNFTYHLYVMNEKTTQLHMHCARHVCQRFRSKVASDDLLVRTDRSFTGRPFLSC